MSVTRRPRNRCPLHVEALESLTLLSGPTPASPAGTVLMASVRASSVGLSAQTTGAYLAVQAKPVGGLVFTVDTAGTALGLGAVHVYGKLATPGFKAAGHTTGTLLVSAPGGTLTLAVVGPTQTGYAGLPSSLNFSIVGGTGKFHGHYGGSGSIATQILSQHSGALKTLNGQLRLNFTAA